MKASEDFVIVVDKDGLRVPYKSGDPKTGLKFTQVKKGSQIPEAYLKEIAEKNIDLIADIVYEDKVPINLPKGVGLPVVSKKMKIKKRKYSQESLTKIKNEEGFSALKKIGEEFGVTDRSSKRLIVEILRAQEEKQRAGL
ncbi:MAG: hypothetical protein CMH64_01735 [Nanoarchaeota archaeon]|jgi:hypothetical protein|nr:hypothetical protein [Nanoarchaeota archaeon]|tara:strand:+ start:72 stop:491 length:420 start_codon:yes stop_codon:yes gene_type:complete